MIGGAFEFLEKAFTQREMSKQGKPSSQWPWPRSVRTGGAVQRREQVWTWAAINCSRGCASN